MPVKIHNKEYYTVAERIAKLHEKHDDCDVRTKLIASTDNLVVVKATVKAGGKVATGYAEEDRSASSINKTSAMENAETSAVGRALAFLGYAGTEIASADEVAQAITQQKINEALEQQLSHMAAVREHWYSVAKIKEALELAAANESGTDLRWQHLEEALLCWRELGQDTMRALWKAPTKGGVFTTEERKLLDEASNEAHSRNIEDSAA